jgi:hypothetical protein
LHFNKIKGGGKVFLGYALKNYNPSSDNTFDVSYKLLHCHAYKDLEKAAATDNISISTKTINSYWEDLKKHHFETINGKTNIVKGLYLLYQTANALEIHNDSVLHLKQKQFRNKILYPNLVYILTQHIPETRKFLQATMLYMYNFIKKKSPKLVNLYVNTFYLDEDIIKHHVLYEFLGNGLKKFDPIIIDNVNSFYRTMFGNIFHYFFMKKQQNSVMVSNFWNMESSITATSSTRLNIYRNVLYDLQVDKFYESSPVYLQLGYNYRIFRNIIVNNELQDVYMSSGAKDSFSMNNNEYKLLKIFNDDIINTVLLTEIKKLPIIFKLLKCVHLANPKIKPYNEMLINQELVKVIVYEELLFPFKNVFSEGYIQPILTKISNNFVDSILSGEYINLLTLSNVRIDQVSFIDQLRKFVRICLKQMDTLNV